MDHVKFLKFLTLLDNSLIRNVDAAVELRKEATHEFFVGLEVVLLEQIFEIFEEIVKDLDADHVPKARLYLVEERIVLDDHVEILRKTCLDVLRDFLIKLVTELFAFVCVVQIDHPFFCLLELDLVLVK